MKLAAKIFTALAIAFAISYVAARDYTPDASAAAGKIDVLNVGTCYATSSDVFGEADCRDNLDDNDQYNLAESGASGGAGIRDLKQMSKVYSTYAVDPKTSAEEPRGILLDSDLVKVSILDPGRDRRTPVLLKAGGSDVATAGRLLETGGANPTTAECYGTNNEPLDTPDLTPAGTATGLHHELCAVYKLINDDFFQNAPKDDLLNFNLEQRFEARDNNGDIEYISSRASNHIVDVRIPASAPDSEDYRPLHFKLNPDGATVDTSATTIRWYGYLIHATAGEMKSGCETVLESTANDVHNASAAPKICDLSGFIGLDEDIGSGRTYGENADDPTSHTAPYITLNVELPGAHTARVRYVYYETSAREDIVGGAKRSARTANSDVDTYDGSTTNAAVADTSSASAPVFTNDESGAQPDALVVESVGDGVVRSANLWLTETGRFTGRYEGYLRLTDANGNAVETGTESEPNWGREVGKATSSQIDGAAVLGVQGGPVNIRYRDSDGSVQTLEIAIDTQPPLINVENPVYKANFDDQRVLVTGTFSDADSGLRDDSFRLYLDNLDDDDEDGENNADQVVLKLYVNGTDTESGDGKSAGYVTLASSADVVQLTEDYMGYADDDAGIDATRGLFGVLKADWLYKRLTQTTGEGDAGDEFDALKTIDPDAYSDGASEAVFNDIARLDIVDSNGDSVDELNNQIDFQALVLDLAGNVGFSDSDPAGPTFIHDYGTKSSDRKDGRYNVLGWYARHIISIDQVDPRLGRVVTGFYGENDDDEAQPNVRGLWLMFDGAIDASSVDNGTFKVELDSVAGADPINGIVTDVSVEGDSIYLLLDEDLLPDATPKLSVNSGRSVRDPAGNQLSSNDELNNDDGSESREIESNDGIPPTLSVTLSRGSGTGDGDEGPSRLTNESIVVRVTSNESIQGAPNVVFVCNDFTWNDENNSPDDATDDVTRDLQDVIKNRSGKKTTANASQFAPGGDVDGHCDDDDTADLSLRYIGTYSRPGNAWEYQWRNDPNEGGSLARLPDGDVTVVAFGRDTSDWLDDYKPGDSSVGEQSYNWGAATAEFELDSDLRAPTDAGFGSVQPAADGVVFESRPFVLLTFRDASTVTVDSFEIDGTAQDITNLGNNRFLYWPESLSFGKHKVEVDSVDAAANERTFSYEFEVKQRSAFNVELLAGWNAVSVPAMPVEPTIENVFTIAEVDQVVSWESSTPEAPWRIATKVDGVWSTNSEFAPLTTIQAGKGYWVHANGFVDQSVMLTGIPDRESAANAPAGPIGIATVKGWNFVGVVDTDGDQTQDGDFGEELKNSKDEMVTATAYLRTYKRAYTWDPIKLQFNVVEGGDNVEIGDGIWVYYADGFNLAP